MGQSLLEREHTEGHVLGLHTGTTRGHVSHTWMSRAGLNQSLRDGRDDIGAITGHKTILVRPPYWSFNTDTLAEYGRQGLHMMLSDVKAYDGVNWGLHVFKRWNFRSQLGGLRARFLKGSLPGVNGTIPIIVSLHDTNPYTADHLGEYLELVLDEACRVRLPLDRKPFYDDHAEAR